MSQLLPVRMFRRPERREFWMLVVLGVAGGWLAGCASKNKEPQDFPEPRGTSEDADFWDRQSNSSMTRARVGDADALHATFVRVLDLEQEGAGSFQYDIRALRDALGDERFFAALARESAEVQRMMAPFAPR